MIIVKKLIRYPIKGCGGEELSSAVFDQHGIVYDRRWMLVTPSGRFMSQRATKDKPGSPRMALIRAAVRNGRLEVTAPEMPLLSLDVHRQTRDRIQASLHDDTFEVVVVDAAASSWFSAFLGTPSILVTYPRFFERRPRIVRPGVTSGVGFADAWPVLAVTQESIDDLNTRLETPVGHDRFRPNILLQGARAPFAEFSWRTLEFVSSNRPPVWLHDGGPCSRCVVIDTDQQRGERKGKGPLLP